MEDNKIDFDQFTEFHNFLKRTYPNIHSRMLREVVDGYSLLYRWPGIDINKRPRLLMAHMDVVPVEENTDHDWTHKPFSGDIAGGYIWGRGAIDMKGQLIAIMEACETLIAAGFKPQGDIYIAIGHNEERQVETGAITTAKLLAQRRVHFEYVLDEGGSVFDGKILGIKGSVAGIGVCEKGYADITLTASGEGGHASMPPKHTALGDVAEAITLLEANPLPYGMKGPVKELVCALTPYMKGSYKFIFSNRWLFGPIAKAILKKRPMLAAMMHTTIAATMASGSKSSNVLPQRAKAVLHVRIAPWNTIDYVQDYIQTTIGEHIKVKATVATAPTKISRTNSEAYRKVESAARNTLRNLKIVPYMTTVTTDSRFYEPITDSIFRFVPFRSIQEDISGMHGTNERLKLDSLLEGINFFMIVIEKN
jgi:carboxypeptidase PM20D1